MLRLRSADHPAVVLAADGSAPGLPGLGELDFRQAVKTLFGRWVRTVRKAVPVEAIEKALAEKSAVAIVSDPIWRTSWDAVTEAWQERSLEVIQRTGAKSLGDLGFDARFDLDNPHANHHAREMSATRIVEIGDETKEAIRQVVGRGFIEGHSPRQQAKEIRGLVGLTTRDALAADRRFAKLLDEGVPMGRALKLTRQYAQRLHRRRASNIARTETIDAQNAGLQAAWKEADEQGLVAHESRRKWIAATASDRTCKTCRPLNGQYATVHGYFTSPSTGKVFGRPPAHPSCRCTQGLVTPAPGERLPDPPSDDGADDKN